MEAAARPLPKLDTTPPVTKTYFADIYATSYENCLDWMYQVGTIKYVRIGNAMEAEKRDGRRFQPAHEDLSIMDSTRYKNGSSCN
jgi:hypothetical protein